MQISLILKIQSLYVWKSSYENFSLLAEAKCHAVWKMIVCKVDIVKGGEIKFIGTIAVKGKSV